jgi:hypothetical protein
VEVSGLRGERSKFNVQVESRFCMLDGREDIQEEKDCVLELLSENKKTYNVFVSYS